MKCRPSAIPAILLAFLMLNCSSHAQSPLSNGSQAPPPVTAPPESFFAQVRDRDRDAARAFYKKYIDIRGLAVVASAEVADAALQRDYDIVTHMLAGRPDIIKSMVDAGTHLIIIGKDQLYTDMPEYWNTPNPAYQNERVRGTGGNPALRLTFVSRPICDRSNGLNPISLAGLAASRRKSPWAGSTNMGSPVMLPAPACGATGACRPAAAVRWANGSRRSTAWACTFPAEPRRWLPRPS